MQFIPASDWEEGSKALGERLAAELEAGKKVLWLVSGGSNIEASVRIMNSLDGTHLQNLSISLVDERYGQPGHKDSNWQQLMAAGFDGRGAKLLPVLQAGLSLQQATEHYDQLISQAFGQTDIVIAQLGIGDDGHIAGILPHTVAAEETDRLVVGYVHPSYQRLTLSFTALRRLDVAYAFSFGAGKAPALRALQTQDLPLAEQPSQILKQLPEAYLYSDQVEPA